MASVLHDIVRKLLDEDRLAAPEDVAREALDLLPPIEYHRALSEVLPGWVRVQAAQRRMHLSRAPRNDFPGDQMLRDTQRCAVAGEQERNTDPAYSKWTSSFQQWQQELDNQRISTGPNPEDWKFFRDLTALDCAYKQAESLKLAAANQAQADKWDATRKAMEESGVQTAGALPVEKKAAIWQ